MTERYVGTRRTPVAAAASSSGAAGPTPEQVAERIAAAGGRARFAGRVALGVYGDEDIPTWSGSVTGSARENVRGLTSLAVAEAAPMVALLLVLPQAAVSAGVSTAAIGSAVLLPLAVMLFAVFPAATAGAGRRRVAVALGFGINLGVVGVVLGQAFAPALLATLVGLRAVLTVYTWAAARPLLVDSVVPEARVRALTRWRVSWLLGAALGAFGAGMATVGPAVGAGLAVTGTSVVALLVSVLSLGVKDPGVGGVEGQRVAALFGPEVAEDLTAGTPGSAALTRVLRTEAARVTLTGYVGVGFGLLGLLVPAQAAIAERGAEGGVTPGTASLAIAAAFLVAAPLLLAAGPRLEALRRLEPGAGAKPAVLGLVLVLVGVLGLGVIPTAAVLPAAYCVAVLGAMIAAVALDGMLFSVVAPGDRAAAAGLTGLSTTAGGVLGYGIVAITTSQTGDLRLGLLVASLVVVFLALATRRPARLATSGLDDAIGAEAEDAVVADLVGEDAVIPVLAARDINFSYGSVQALFGVTLTVRPGELVALLGPNGVGKTTMLRVLSGLASPSRGVVRIEGKDQTETSAPDRVALGLSQIVGGQAVFGAMTVAENLRMYGYSLGKDRAAIESGMEQAYATFPRLSDRRNQLASTLSGGEQQMLGLSKALILSPKVLLIDEFSLGLAPVVVGQLMESVRRLNERGTAVLLVEQSVNVALSLVDRVYFMEKGRITYEGRAEDLRGDPELVAALSMGGAVLEELEAFEQEHDGTPAPVGGAEPVPVAAEGIPVAPAPLVEALVPAAPRAGGAHAAPEPVLDQGTESP